MSGRAESNANVAKGMLLGRSRREAVSEFAIR
jgi:hypothetical protein